MKVQLPSLDWVRLKGGRIWHWQAVTGAEKFPCHAWVGGIAEQKAFGSVILNKPLCQKCKAAWDRHQQAVKMLEGL